MNWPDILLTAAFTTAAMAALAFLLKEWISARLKESISAEYKKALEVFKQQLIWEDKRKQQAAEIAELFSLWLQSNYDKKKDANLGRYELQKKYWQLALWLDAPVLRAVHQALASANNPGITHKAAMISVRRLFVDKDDPVQPEELYHWDPVNNDKT
jgi:hypothetical protein